MKSRRLLYICLFAIAFCACNDKKGQTDEQGYATAEKQAGEHRMKDYNLTDSVALGSHLYVYTIHREADDSLTAVVDENGDKFVDNYYDLTILKDGRDFFCRPISGGRSAACTHFIQCCSTCGNSNISF